MVGRNPDLKSITHWHLFIPDSDYDYGGGG